VKNLSPSQISLSALKGEGELLNLELNEVSRGDLQNSLEKIQCSGSEIINYRSGSGSSNGKSRISDPDPGKYPYGSGSGSYL